MKTVKISQDALLNIKGDWIVYRYGDFVADYITRAAARAAKEVGADFKMANKKEVEFEVIAPAPVVEETPAPKAPKTPKIPLIRESTIERPCKQVWHIADAMKDEAGGDVSKMSRKAVLAKCVASGIAFYTARTQYQMWLTIQNGGTLK